MKWNKISKDIPSCGIGKQVIFLIKRARGSDVAFGHFYQDEFGEIKIGHKECGDFDVTHWIETPRFEEIENEMD